ncbi:MAG: hypothetical protein HQL45_07915 [Alphaproteobacteria bacterium]|nr:hypothetical protein [Alphaproteobacteria bacterium]
MTETLDQIASSPSRASRADPRAGERSRKASGGGGSGRLVLIVLFLMLMGGAAAWTEIRPYVEPLLGWLPASSFSSARPVQTLPPSEASSERAAMLEAALSSAAIRLEQAEQRLALVESQLRQATQQRPQEDSKELPPKPLAAPLPADKPLQTGGDDMPANAAGPAEKPDDLRKRQGERVARGSLVLLAVRQLRESVDRGTPFETELQVARSLGPGKFAKALEFLAPLAQTGIPTRAVLMERYKPSASAALAANSQLGSNWLEGRVSQFFSSAITVRRTDGSGDGNGDALRRAEKLVAEGDLIGCVDALRLLQGPAANAMLPWMQAAVTRINADRALSEILSAAISAANESGD